MKIAVAQLGARMHYAVPQIFHHAGMLQRLYTDSYSGNKPWIRKLLHVLRSFGLRRGALDRWTARDAGLPITLVTSFEGWGLKQHLRLRSCRTVHQYQIAHAQGNREFNLEILRRGLDPCDAVYLFETAALEIFEHARAGGWRCILEQTIAPRPWADHLLMEEAERWPGWEPSLENALGGHNPLAEREQHEWSLADQIICGSEFVRSGIARVGGPVEKCTVVPYGVKRAAARRHKPAPNARTRVLFAGQVGLRKGAPYLLEALRALGPRIVEARFAGSVAIAREKLTPFTDVAEFLGPVPRPSMSALYDWADVLVLPSLVEGSATVTYEALVRGLPIIVTPNTGAYLLPSQGLLVPQRDTEALVEAILQIGKWKSDGKPREPSDAHTLEAYADRLLRAVACS
jgi:glycosyltransferase involved in cell wall biosynthesis